jgi:uncharacterized protein YqeY
MPLLPVTGKARAALNGTQEVRNDMLRERFENALKNAVLTRDSRTTSTMRLILAALKDRDIAERAKGNHQGITEDQILQMLRSMIKQRQDSIQLYEKGNRTDLASGEAEEISIIEQFLPRQLDAAEMAAAIAAAVEETDAQTLRDMGKVMALLKERFAGGMDFSRAGALVKEKLS